MKDVSADDIYGIAEPDFLIDGDYSDEADILGDENRWCVQVIDGEDIWSFISVNATLPLGKPDSPLICGLWVLVDTADFERYRSLRYQGSEAEYAGFSCLGSLDNTWPMFERSWGAQVELRVVDSSQKPYITRVLGTDSQELAELAGQATVPEAFAVRMKEHLRLLLRTLPPEA